MQVALSALPHRTTFRDASDIAAWRRWTRPEDESFSTASEKLICWWTEEDRGSAGQLSFSLCYCVAAESVHFSGMPNHLRLKLRSLPDTVIVPPGVWCRWPKTLSLFHHCTHSISELPTKKKINKKSESSHAFSSPPAVAACLFMKQSCCLVLFCCAVRLCCKNLAGFYPSAAWSTDSSDVAWKAGWTDEGSGRAGVWPAARCESAGSMGDLCYWMGLTLNSAPCSVADNGLITNVPALQFAQRRQPGQSEKKPWWAARGGGGVGV